MRRHVAVLAAVACIGAAVVAGTPIAAHKTAVSPYTFHRDVVPIIDARCGRCHSDGSASGLSLFRYESARGATWLMRQQLVSNHMPPWFADGPFKSPAPLSARELNVLMTWATGGAPEGAIVPHQNAPPASWAFGRPDVIIPMPAAFEFSGNDTERVHEVSLPSTQVRGRMIRAVDLLPGTRAIVRRAEIVSRNGAREQVLGLWQPGESPAGLEANAAFQIPSNASLAVRIFYRRHYGDPASDRSQVGIYFAPRSAPAVQAMELTAEVGQLTSQRVDRAARAIAIRPVSGPSGAWVRFTVIDSKGARRELGRLQLQRYWERRYVFDTPISLQVDDRIEISIMPANAELWSSLIGAYADAPGPARVVVEFVN